MSRMVRGTALVMGIALLAISETALAKTLTLGRTETNTDFVSTGVGGIGDGPGTLTVSGVSGDVRKAFLYWHGINNSGAGAEYDNATITFAGEQVIGMSLGDAETNCWNPGSSRAFFADVTELVNGNGSYTIDGLDAQVGHNGNGASLIVLFDDGNNANNRDLVFFEGNDSDVVQYGFPGETTGWAATLNDISYLGGSVFAQMHVGDGQNFGQPDDGSITFTGVNPVTFADPNFVSLWDGASVANGGASRDANSGLWDIHTFDISGAFDTPGNYTINFSGMASTSDCHSLVVMMLDLAEGSAPCGNGVFNEGEECDPAGTGDADCGEVETCLNDCTCGCANDAQCNDGVACTIDSCNTETGACTNDSSECDLCEGMCGDPLEQFGRISAIDAQFILRASVELEKCALCVCDVDSSGEILSSDALRALRYAVGLPVDLDCPAGVASTTTTTTLPEVTTTTLPEVTTTTLPEVTTTTIPETTTTTLAPFCGDGAVNEGEECDDANTGSGDGCTSECVDEFCGDGIDNDGAAEECDDANSSNEDSCVEGCVAATCGDGFVQSKVEQCDDANTSDSDACVTGCVNAFCGDGLVQEGVEECDDGAPTAFPRGGIVFDPCLDDCTLPKVTTTTLQPLLTVE